MNNTLKRSQLHIASSRSKGRVDSSGVIAGHFYMNMQLNRKRRKLQFIRRKNDINNGVTVNTYIKISSELKDDPKRLEIIKDQIDKSWKSLKKVYRLKFDPSKIEHQLVIYGDDFMKHLYTIKLTFAR